MANDDLITLFKDAAWQVGGHKFDDISMKTEIADLGIDSVELLEIFGYVEEETGVLLSDDDLATIENLGDLGELIQKAS